MIRTFDGKLFATERHFADGSTMPALTPFGARFVESGFLRGYGYVRGGETGYFGPRAKGPAYATLRKALAAGNLQEIATAAKRLPSVRVRVDTRYPGNANYGFCVSRNGCALFCAPYLNAV